jgi:hypothetical protein
MKSGSWFLILLELLRTDTLCAGNSFFSITNFEACNNLHKLLNPNRQSSKKYELNDKAQFFSEDDEAIQEFMARIQDVLQVLQPTSIPEAPKQNLIVQKMPSTLLSNIAEDPETTFDITKKKLQGLKGWEHYYNFVKKNFTLHGTRVYCSICSKKSKLHNGLSLSKNPLNKWKEHMERVHSLPKVLIRDV